MYAALHACRSLLALAAMCNQQLRGLFSKRAWDRMGYVVEGSGDL
jgi:hypothetical protein